MSLRLGLLILLAIGDVALAQNSTTIFLSDEQSLLVSSGTTDNETRDYILVNSSDKKAATELLPNVAIPATAASLTSPLTVAPHRQALLRLQWSAPLHIWWVQTFVSASARNTADLKPANNLLLRGKGHPVWDWVDGSHLVEHTIRQGALSITMPASRDYHWINGLYPLAVGRPSPTQLKGNWILECKMTFTPGPSFVGKSFGAIGVKFDDGRAMYVVHENDPSGRKFMSLNIYPYIDNLSLPYNGASCYLRLQRDGTIYTIAYSSDRKNWITGPATFSHPDDPTSLFLGVSTWYGGADVTYTFEYLTLTPIK